MMSCETTVEVSQGPDGRYTAVEPESGATGEGGSRAEALADLAQALATVENATQMADVTVSLQEALALQRESVEQLMCIQEKAIENTLMSTHSGADDDVDESETVAEKTSSEATNAAAFVALAQGVQKRFREENVDEDDVADAIRWARSQ